MTIKTILYIVVVPLVLYALDGINLNQIFKKNRYHQSRLMYLIFTISLSYLVVNFFYDFFMYTQII